MFYVPMSHAAARAVADGLTITDGAPEWIAAPTDVAAKVAATIDQLEVKVKTTEAEAPKAAEEVAA